MATYLHEATCREGGRDALGMASSRDCFFRSCREIWRLDCGGEITADSRAWIVFMCGAAASRCRGREAGGGKNHQSPTAAESRC